MGKVIVAEVTVHLTETAGTSLRHNNRTQCGRPWTTKRLTSQLLVTNAPTLATCEDCRARWFGETATEQVGGEGDESERDDVETLAALFATCPIEDPRDIWHDYARTFLASDWLAVRLAAAKAEAWDEGWNAVRNLSASLGEVRGFINKPALPTNPYRAAEQVGGEGE